MKYFSSLAAIATIVCCLLTGCGKSAKSPKIGSDPDAPAAGCNLLLISLDTTRADRLGCYGWKRASTPALDVLARRGTRFEHAYSHVPITLPSHASLLTGTRPPENGVRDNGRFALGKDLPTLAEIFKQHGYETAAFIGAAVLNARYGLNRGFDTYDDEMPRRPTGRPFLDRHADRVCESALKWLDKNHDRPFMCWVHFFDPHAPYAPPKLFLDRTGDPYDGEIAFADAHIGRLLDWLSKNDLADRTLVVVVADHGESLGEHGYNWHALLVYDSNLHVPMIITLPKLLPDGQVCTQLACLSDVMPTVLDLIGWDIPDDVTGHSLKPALLGGDMSPRSIYAETEFPYYSFGWSTLQALVTDDWKYIRAPRVELYDRHSDASEMENLAEERPEIVTRLEGELSHAEESMVLRESAEVDLDAEARSGLESLGYVVSATSQPASAGNRDPKDMLPVVYDYRAAESLLGAGKPNEAIALLEPLVEKSPESFVIFDKLGEAYAAVGRLDEARYMLLDALDLVPNSPETYLNLAHTLAMQGRFPAAIKACTKAIEIGPPPADAEPLLERLKASQAAQRRQIDAAQQQWSIDPSPDAALMLANLLDVAGRAKDAATVLHAAIVRYPDNAPLLNASAWLMATSMESAVRDGSEALKLAQAATSIQSDDPNYLDTMAAAYAETGDFDRAIATLDDAIAGAKKMDAGADVPALEFHRRLYANEKVFRTP